MLFAILTFLIVGSMVAGYCLRVARLEKQYDDTDQTIDELIAALNVEREWTKARRRDQNTGEKNGNGKSLLFGADGEDQ